MTIPYHIATECTGCKKMATFPKPHPLLIAQWKTHPCTYLHHNTLGFVFFSDPLRYIVHIDLKSTNKVFTLKFYSWTELCTYICVPRIIPPTLIHSPLKLSVTVNKIPDNIPSWWQNMAVRQLLAIPIVIYYGDINFSPCIMLWGVFLYMM